MSGLEVDLKIFISKKMAQFLILLNDKEEHSPDLFIEYILAKMIYKQCKKRIWLYKHGSDREKKRIKKDGSWVCQKGIDFENIKERNKYVKDTVTVLTEFMYLLGADGMGDDSLAFWDWDFSFLDSHGFEWQLFCLQILSSGTGKII